MTVKGILFTDQEFNAISKIVDKRLMEAGLPKTSAFWRLNVHAWDVEDQWIGFGNTFVGGNANEE